MPIPYTIIRSVDQFDFSFIENENTVDIIQKFIAHLIDYQLELEKDDLCELIYLKEIIEGDVFERYINYMNEIKKRMRIVVIFDGVENIIDVFYIAFDYVHDLIVYGYEQFKEMYFLNIHKYACIQKRVSGDKTDRVMKEYSEVEVKMAQMKIAKTQEKINHWFSKDF